MLYMPCSPIPVAYVPRRSAAKNRQVTDVTFGIYCMYVDYMGQLRYTAVLDIDRHVPPSRLEQICGTICKYLRTNVAMICETCKGYHIYVSDFWYSPIQLYHRLMKLCRHVPELDKYQIKLGYVRSETWCGWMIIRLGGKYSYNDIKVIYYEPEKVCDRCHRKWLMLVHTLIRLLNQYEPRELARFFKVPVAYFR